MLLSRTLRPLAALLLFAGAAAAALPKPQVFGEFRPSIFVTCTPKTIEVIGQGRKEARNPIAVALGMAGPGSRIKLMPGDYPAFGIGYTKPAWWNAHTPGGFPGNPIVVEALGKVRIMPSDRGDTISIHQGKPSAHITFQGLTIVPSYRAAVMFTKTGKGKKHTGFHFEDCSIEGAWDHVQNRGTTSKWGVWGHSLDDFVFRGLRARAEIKNLRYEHAFYLQNPTGNVTIENVDAHELGRTFVQLTNRKGDGPPGKGTFTVRDCRVSDIGLSKDDNHKGGSAFTFAGRHTGTILVERCHYKAGFDPKLRKLTRGDAPYGTGALVAWDGNESVPNRALVLRDNVFEFAPECGDRAVVSIGGCKDVRILGYNRFVAGAHAHALSLDPVEGGSKPKSVPNGSVYLEAGLGLVGGLALRTKPISDEKREEYAKEPETAIDLGGLRTGRGRKPRLPKPPAEVEVPKDAEVPEEVEAPEEGEAPQETEEPS